MAGDWIKMEKATATKPEVLQLADILGIHPAHAFGLCFRFWSWADDQLTDGHARGVTNVTLDSIIGHAGFSTALLNVGWLQARSGSLVVPNFDRHLSESAKNRALSGDRKKNQREKVSREKRDKSVTREEKRRDNNIEGRPAEITIPESLNDDECRATAETWMDYLDSKNLQDKSPRGNEIALQAWWRQMARFGRSGFLEAVPESMAAGRWNVELRQSFGERAKRAESKDWLAALKAAKTHPSDWQKRRDILGEELFEALKRTGSKAVAESNDFEQKTLKDLFESHLKDIRSGIKTSN